MLTIRCTLLRDTFEGGASDDPARAEWPPSPMRLFSALVAVADHASDVDEEVLRTLEALPPPEILAPPALVDEGAYRRAFVPTNSVASGGGSTTFPGRTNGERGWPRAVPASPQVWYRWLAGELSDETRAHIARLCRQVPYFGRSTSPALVEVIDDEPPAQLGRLVPDSSVSSSFDYKQTLRSAYPGSLDALRDAYHSKYRQGRPGDPWEVGLPVDYGAPGEAEPRNATVGPYVSMVVLALVDRQLDGRHAARVASYVRRALMHGLDGRAVAALNGHHDGSVVQCAVLPLPFVGAPYADGHLLGVAIAMPELSREDRTAIHRALLKLGSMPVLAGPLGELRFERLSPLEASAPRARSRAWGLDPDRWSRPARTWVSAFPAVLDRYLKRRDDVEAEVRRAVMNSGYPEPAEVELSLRPLLEGAPDFRPEETIRRAAQRGFKPYRHLRLRFAERIQGPVVIGSMRHYGLGLCVPLPDEER